MPQGSNTALAFRLTQVAHSPAGLAPITSKGLLETIEGIEQPPKSQLRVDQFALNWTKGVRCVHGGTRPRIFAAQEPCDDRDILRLVDRETAVFRPADDPMLIDQDAIGDGLEAEERTRDPMLVDDGREHRLRLLDERSGCLSAGVLHGDREQLEGIILALLARALPPGQLLAAASPRAPVGQQQPLAAQIAKHQVSTVEAGQGDVWVGIAHAGNDLGYRCHQYVLFDLYRRYRREQPARDGT